MLTQAPKGTKDVLPQEAYKWHYVESIMRSAARLNGYREVRTPGFEHTELFLRGVGDTTDVVQKEMYTFNDKGDRSITLKPEGTAGVARAFIEHGLFNESMPLKMFYFTPVYRYERPQSGRLREHHQFGIEAFGGSEATLDAEIIMLGLNVLKQCGLTGLSLNINSIGCPECRKKYNDELRRFFSDKALCETCKTRLEKNPMRILDCKDADCKSKTEGNPVILDYICDDCRSHFEHLKAALNAAGVEFTVDPRIVRGLDYYTKTVFEIIADVGDGKLTVCGGGRYDGLVEQLGGKPMCGAGFGMGIERLLMLLEAQGKLPQPENVFDVFIVSGQSDKEKTAAFVLAQKLRAAGVKTECEHCGRSFKAQFKFADKQNVKYCVVIGERELEQGKYVLKNMLEGSQCDASEQEIIEELTK